MAGEAKEKKQTRPGNRCVKMACFIALNGNFDAIMADALRGWSYDRPSAEFWVLLLLLLPSTRPGGLPFWLHLHSPR